MAKRRFKSAEDIAAAERAVLAARDAEIARIKSETAERLREISEERAAIGAAERARRRKVQQGMSFALGEFLLREYNGGEFEDKLVRAIVESEQFETFMRAARYRGRRGAFGLSDLGDSAVTDVATKKRRAS